MEKARRPHVVRTWTVERTKVPYRTPQPAKRSANEFGTRRMPRRAGPPPEKSN